MEGLRSDPRPYRVIPAERDIRHGGMIYILEMTLHGGLVAIEDVVADLLPCELGISMAFMRL